MEKKYFLVLVVIIIVFVMFYYSIQSTSIIPSNLEESKNKTSTPSNLPGQQSSQNSTNTPNNGSGSSDDNSSGSSGDSGSFGGESSNQINQTKIIPKINYTLNIDSFPGGLKIFASYYVNDIKSSLTSGAPFDLEVDSNSTVCVFPAYITGSGVLKWTLDEQDCQFSTCEDSSYGCLVNMNANHTVMLHYTPV